MDGLRDLVTEELQALRAENIDHLACGHCGGINDVREVDMVEQVRHLCVDCRCRILEWI